MTSDPPANEVEVPSHTAGTDLGGRPSRGLLSQTGTGHGTSTRTESYHRGFTAPLDPTGEEAIYFLGSLRN